MSRSYVCTLVRRLKDDREQWKVDHDEVNKKFDRAKNLSEAADHYLYILSRVDNSCEPPPREYFHKMNLSWADSLCQMYGFWYTHASELLSEVEGSEQDGFEVKKSSELRAAIQHVGQMLPDMERLRRRINDIRAGKCVSLKDALDGMGTLSSPGCCEAAR